MIYSWRRLQFSNRMPDTVFNCTTHTHEWCNSTYFSRDEDWIECLTFLIWNNVEVTFQVIQNRIIETYSSTILTAIPIIIIIIQVYILPFCLYLLSQHELKQPLESVRHHRKHLQMEEAKNTYTTHSTKIRRQQVFFLIFIIFFRKVWIHFNAMVIVHLMCVFDRQLEMFLFHSFCFLFFV